MAHIEKFTKGAMGHMLTHYDRSKNNLGENIDTDKTHLNYNLAEHQKLRQLDFIHKRLSEVKVQNRKDVNVMCDWVVTIPKDFLAKYPYKEKEFFKATYDFLESKYGRENVISAYVHRDEKTPHMHFAFIPVVKNKRKGGYKVSAKEAVTISDLRAFHPNLSKYLEEKLGVAVNVLNEATKEGNKSIAELKRSTAKQELQRTAAELAVQKKQMEANREYMTMYDSTNVKPIEYKELSGLTAKIAGKNKVLADKDQINSVNNQLKSLVVKNSKYTDITAEAEAKARQIVEQAKIQSEKEAQIILEKNKAAVDNLFSSKEEQLRQKEKFIDDKAYSVNKAIEDVETENRQLKRQLRGKEALIDKAKLAFARLAMVTDAEHFPQAVKDYVNTGKVTRTKEKSRETQIER